MMSRPATISGPSNRHGQDQDHARMLSRMGYRGLAVLLLFMASIGWWAVTVPIAGSVMAPAALVPAVQPVPISHLTGGAVASLHVREGQPVAAGDMLLRLEDTAAQANLAIVARQVDETRVHLARLAAEYGGADRISFDEDLVERARQSPDLDRLLNAETRLFQTRAATRNGLIAQLEQRIVQLGNQIDALQGQRSARQAELAVNETELDGVRSLHQRGLVPVTRFAALERNVANLQGQIGQMSAQISQLNSRIAETRLEMLQIGETARKDALGELRDVETRIFDITGRRTMAQDLLARMTLTAPVDGIVHRLAVQAQGTVLRPGEAALQIVPQTVPLRANLRIQPRDIDLIHVGQHVRIKLDRAAGQAGQSVPGKVTRVATDVSRENPNGPHSYLAQVELDEAAVLAWQGEPLRAGMMGEAFVDNGSRTLASYIMAPILQQFAMWR